MNTEDNLTDEESPSVAKRIYIILLGLFLLILLLSYFLISHPIYPILESLFESKLSHGDKILLDNFSIIFEGETYKTLQELYYSDQSNEFAACLIGYKNNDYIITSLYIPETIDQSFNHVKFRPCSDDTLILLHSHPFRRCIASEQDLNLLNETKKSNPNLLIIIMCEPNRFSIYS